MATIEHVVIKRDAPEQKNNYLNCLYACRLCNTSRGTFLSTAEACVLDPCTQAWGDAFEVSGDELLPKAGNPDAAYTADVYEINEPRKVARRRARREDLEAAVAALIEAPSQMEAVQERMQEPGADVPSLLRELRLQRRFVQLAWRVIEKHRAIPVDAPSACRCKKRGEEAIPEWLALQLREVARPAAALP